jgi:hypothetical protein
MRIGSCGEDVVEFFDKLKKRTGIVAIQIADLVTFNLFTQTPQSRCSQSDLQAALALQPSH